MGVGKGAHGDQELAGDDGGQNAGVGGGEGRRGLWGSGAHGRQEPGMDVFLATS